MCCVDDIYACVQLARFIRLVRCTLKKICTCICATYVIWAAHKTHHYIFIFRFIIVYTQQDGIIKLCDLKLSKGTTTFH